MSSGRGLELNLLLRTIEPDTLIRLFQHVGFSEHESANFAMWADSFQAFVDDPVNAERVRSVLPIFGKLSEMAFNGLGTLYRAYSRFNIAMDDRKLPAELATRLFLSSPEAFSFARTRYLVQSGTASMSVYNLGVAEVKVSSANLKGFREAVREWFSAQGKGEHVVAKTHNDGGEVFVLVLRGERLEGKPMWEDDGTVGIVAKRPAVEDVIVFDPLSFELRIRASLPKDRETYLRLFALHVVGDGKLADQVLSDRMFSLAPIQEGSFSYGGAGIIAGVELVGAKMRLFGATNCVVTLRADDVQRAFRYDLGGLTMESGVLTSAKLRFRLQARGVRATTMTFEVEPPRRTDLPEREHAPLVMEYLRAQGVKLK